MLFVLGKLAGILTSPSTLLLILALLGGWLSARPRPRPTARWLLAVGLGGYAAIWLLPVEQWALLPLEDRFPRPAPPAHVDGIIVLGGAVLPDLTADRGIPALNDAAERMTAAAALALRYPGARLVFTGGNGSLLPNSTREADTANALFLSLGVPSAQIVLEDRSRTTYENVIFTKALMNPEPGQTWVLVTSAMHMPRSVGLFRAAGWDVLPWPVGYKSALDARLWLPGDLGARLMHLDTAVHEWIGLLGYWLEGRIASPFPGPRSGPDN